MPVTYFPNTVRLGAVETVQPIHLASETLFGGVKVAVPTQIIELKSSYGLSAIRDVQTTAGSGAISHTGDEFKLATTASGTDSATLDSAERGRYVPGLVAETGIGVRLPASPSGSQDAMWGLFDDDNGFAFGEDATGKYVVVRRDGSDTKIRQDEWSADRLDGTGPSKITLDHAKGNIFSIEFAWYGYGGVEFSVFVPDKDTLEQQRVVVHRYSPDGETSIPEPNLPIRAHIENGGTAEALDLFVGGRRYAVDGVYSPNRRITSERRLELGSIGDTIIPVISFRRKSSFATTSVKVEAVDVLSSVDMLIEIRTSATLTDASFGTPTNTTAAETSVEADTSATAVSGGELIFSFLVQGGKSKNSLRFNEQDDLNFDFIGNEPVTVCVRKLPSEATGEMSTVFRVREEW